MGEVSPGLYRAGSGEPVLLLHGFTGAWHHWRPVLGELAARYEVIAPTLAGHDGGPPMPAGTAITFASSADLLETHMDELGLPTAHIVGNSMGGALALEMAKRGRARSVVALAPAGGWNPGDGESQRLAQFFARQVRIARATAPRIEFIVRRPGMRRMALRDIMRHGELVSPADAAALSLSAVRCTIAADAIAALRSNSPELQLRELDRITCPVRLATPELDRILPPPLHTPRFRREIPGVDALTLRGCGHVPMWDDTPLVLRTITEFVDRHAARAAESDLQPA
ncbi:MAG TPA: alpha/beta hydrolase [Solirubrobacteraceae bacterium]|jgi:pimeloyl-ACP methyl ester carboxylesterase|nr:alpha/beta hydrolase [Solirubrobacteraceae bacterium]